jgi:hypothetical protein
MDTTKELIAGKILLPTWENAWDIDLRPIGLLRRERLEQFELRKLNVFLCGLLNMPYLQEEDSEPIAAAVGHYRGMNDTGRLAIACEIRWPEPAINNASLSTLGTAVMLRAATELDYDDISQKPRRHQRGRGLVYAHVDRQQGVVLETNEMGSCSMGTDGSWYRPEEAEFSISSHNIYGIDQQIICLAGAVAIARADELIV